MDIPIETRFVRQLGITVWKEARGKPWRYVDVNHVEEERREDDFVYMVWKRFEAKRIG